MINMKKTVLLLLTAVLLFLPFQQVQAWSSFRNETGHACANTVSSKTPTDPTDTGSKWQIKFQTDETTAYNSSPVLTEKNIYIVCRNTLYKLEKDGTICSALTLAASMNSVCHMSIQKNQLFIPLSGGVLQCVDIHSMSSLWTSEAFGMQSLTTTYYRDGYVYAGTTNASGTDGLYYCVRASDGSTQWKYQNTDSPCGYYWSGAVSCETTTVEASTSSDYILFGGDNGVLVSHSATTSDVYDTFDLNTLLTDTSAPKGQIRAGITYDDDTGAYYTTTNNGYLYQIRMTPEGHFDSVLPLCLGGTPDFSANCTSTPTIYHGRIYVCSYYGGHGIVSVVDADSMKSIYSASAPDSYDIKSSPLVCTGYTSEGSHGKVYVYFTQNALPGGIYYIEDTENTTAAEIKPLFLPETGKQFCLASVVADTDGTLYYSNDSGTLFAVQEGARTIPPQTTEPSMAPPSAPPAASSLPMSVQQTGSTSVTPVSKTTKTTKQGKPGKPKKIRFRLKKKKKNSFRVSFSWKKGKNTRYTLLRFSAKKKLRAVGTKKSITLTAGTYTIRFYGCQTTTKKSGAVKIKLRLKPNTPQ